MRSSTPSVSRKLRVLVRQQWAGLIALFLVLTGGTALATHPGGTNTISTGDIINGHVRSADVANQELRAFDLAPNSVGTSEVDGSLTGADVGKAAGVDAIDFGSIAAGSCAGSAILPGVDPNGEAIVVTPSEAFDDNGKLAVSAQDSNVAGFFVVNACNVTGAAIDPPSADFSWVVFDI